ncbi:hypothetical protein JT05_05720 [Desulfosporosinus sp. Tol-M]|jgi:hypothetical protein|nr:hypothetical protein JT05_05720 [Desulfosporosinus sp. Tol-M]
MHRYMVISLVLIIGLGIGSIVPAATSWWYDIHHAGSALSSINAETASTNDDSAIVTYHFGLEQGILSVIEGTPGAGGRVVVTGLNVQAWPKEMLDIVPKVEFYSLDEVQSFIDTVNEPLWQE